MESKAGIWEIIRKYSYYKSSYNLHFQIVKCAIDLQIEPLL